MAAILLFYDVLFGSRVLLSVLKKLLHALSPVFYGAMMAYLLTPVVNFFEEKLFAKARGKSPFWKSFPRFGLVGHLCEMAEGSGVTIRLHSACVPLLPRVLALAEEEVVPGGSGRNQTYFGPRAAFADTVSEAMTDVLYDPQTSGGLLFSLEPEQARLLQSALREQGIPAAIIGEVTAPDGKSLRID